MKFQKFLAESKAAEKLEHIDHVEDHLLTSGEEGYHRAADTLKAVNDKIQGDPTSSRLTTKYDGAPSIIFGFDPETGKFFVATKSVFNEEPKVNFDEKDVERHYKNQPDLAAKLMAALKLLPKIMPSNKGIYQGDLMYTADDVTKDNKHTHFTPNTVMYSVPNDDPDAKAIDGAEMGIAIHTKYHGKDLKSLKASFDPGLKDFKKSKEVHVIDPEVKLDKTLKNSEDGEEFAKHMKNAEDGVDALHPDAFPSMGHPILMKRYINQTVKSGDKPTAVGFKAFLIRHFEGHAEKLKSPTGKLNKKNQMISHMKHVDDHHDHYQGILDVHHHLQKAKDVLVRQLAKGSTWETSIDGKESKGEGFVAIHKGHPSKLVDRAEFSKANFAKFDKKKAAK